MTVVHWLSQCFMVESTMTGALAESMFYGGINNDSGALAESLFYGGINNDSGALAESMFYGGVNNEQ